MNEREMLELAAKAAGMIPKEFAGNDAFMDGVLERWNSLQDDGDALRLAVKLRLVVHVWDDGETVSVAKTLPDGEDPPTTDAAWFAEFAYEGERSIEEATRLAITRAAAQIGKSMS